MRDFKTKTCAYKPIPSLMDANSEIGGHEVTCPFSNQKKTPLFPPNNLEKENKIIVNSNIHIYIIYIYILHHIYIYMYCLSKTPFNWRHPCDYFRSPPRTTGRHLNTALLPALRAAASACNMRCALLLSLRLPDSSTALPSSWLVVVG